MTLPRTAEAWLDWLAVQHPTDADWRDPEFVQLVSWALLLFTWRRMNQRLIDAGVAVEARPEFR